MARIEKHPSGYRVRWEAGKDERGERVRRSRVFKAHEDARTFMRQIAASEGRGAGSERIGDAMQNWIVYRESMRTISPKTAERHLGIARNLADALGNAPLHKINSPLVESALKRLAQIGGPAKRPMAARTIHHHRGLLSQFCKRMVSQGLMTRNPVEGTETPKQPRVKAKAPTLDQVETLLDLCSKSGRCNGLLRIIALTALHTGARRGEILALKWGCVDLDRGEIRIEAALEQTQQPDGMRLRFKAPKTEAGLRTIPISGTLASALRAHRVTQAEKRIRVGAAYAGNHLVFANEIGEPLTPSDVSKRLGHLARDAGFGRDVQPLHGLRHLHGTRLNAAGLDAKTIQARLGHEDISITLQLYVHEDDENARKAADVFEGLGG